MAYTLAQNPTAANGSGSNSISKVFASTVTAHSLMVAFVTTDAAAPGTFTATGGGTWASIAAIKETSSTQWLCILYCLDATGGTTPTVQVSWTGAGTFNGLVIAEFTNSGVASLLDTNTAGSLGNSAAPTDSAMTATDLDAVVSWTICGAGTNQPTVGAGFTFGTNQDTTDLAAWEYKVLTSAGSVTPVFAISAAVPWGIISAAFKPAAGAAPAPLAVPAQPGKTWLKHFKYRQMLALPTVSAPVDQTLTSLGITTGEVLGAGSITTTYTVIPVGITTGEQFGDVAVTPVVSAQGITTAEQFGAGTLSLFTTPQGIVTGEQFGLTNVQTIVSVLPQGITTGEVLGTSTVTPGSVTISPRGITTGEVFGDSLVSVGPSFVTPLGITTGELFGLSAITASVTVAPLGIATGEVLGDVAVVQTIASVGIVSGERFGVSTAQTVVSILPAGIVSGEQFGVSQVTTGQVVVTPAGIGTGEVLGTSVVSVGASQVFTQGITSGERLGTTTITVGSVTLSPAGIPTAERFGTATISGQGLQQTLNVLGIVTAELLGIHNVHYGSAQVNASVQTTTVNASTQTAVVSNSIQAKTI